MTLREILNSVISRLEKEYDLHLGLGEEKLLFQPLRKEAIGGVNLL